MIRAVGLRKSYGDEEVLGPLKLEIERGQRVLLLGANGSGKTTFLKICAGVLEPTKGTVEVDGHPAGSVEARAALSYIADAPVFYDDLSLSEHLQYVGGLHGVVDWEDLGIALAKRLGIEDRLDDRPAVFSRGLKQKAAIALALIRPFDVLLVDEPYVGLDAPGQEAFEQLVDEVQAQGKTLVLATHQLSRIDLAGRCVVLRDGKVVHDGGTTMEHLYHFIGEG